MPGGFEPYPARKMTAVGLSRLSALTPRTRGPFRRRLYRRVEEESVMGVAKKAKHEAKAIKGKTKKVAGKVKHKGKKAKNAAKH
jgi:hypothetical protein